MRKTLGIVTVVISFIVTGICLIYIIDYSMPLFGLTVVHTSRVEGIWLTLLVMVAAMSLAGSVYMLRPAAMGGNVIRKQYTITIRLTIAFAISGAIGLLVYAFWFASVM